MITYYHGTKSTNLTDIIDNIDMTNATNGRGIYLTTDLEVARSYGSVVYWTLEDSVDCIIRRISDANDTLEHVITTVKGRNQLLTDCIDSGKVDSNNTLISL